MTIEDRARGKHSCSLCYKSLIDCDCTEKAFITKGQIRALKKKLDTLETELRSHKKYHPKSTPSMMDMMRGQYGH